MTNLALPDPTLNLYQCGTRIIPTFDQQLIHFISTFHTSADPNLECLTVCKHNDDDHKFYREMVYSMIISSTIIFSFLLKWALEWLYHEGVRQGKEEEQFLSFSKNAGRHYDHIEKMYAQVPREKRAVLMEHINWLWYETGLNVKDLGCAGCRRYWNWVDRTHGAAIQNAYAQVSSKDRLRAHVERIKFETGLDVKMLGCACCRAYADEDEREHMSDIQIAYDQLPEDAKSRLIVYLEMIWRETGLDVTKLGCISCIEYSDSLRQRISGSAGRRRSV
ncbi:hypothetical protein OCU04_002412 [Sclerotinia nivalis]|uniref:Uncharacterized protein n=1 Tax=Sclerotinia nivalis TaxID=352851 RepID=A0A9X0AWZ4_9HELO|nr:hypothetical protein OCU04_002412 [Sclerotinia nivalis]